MRVEEYLHTSFDGADCEYLEGEIVERNTGQIQHARIHAWLAYLLQLASDEARLVVLMSIRIRINERRYRVADLAAVAPIGRDRRDPNHPTFSRHRNSLAG